MQIRYLELFTNQKAQVSPLGFLQDIRLGIDGNVWLKKILPSEQYLCGIGGTPSGLRKAVEKELECFKAASIHPLFVFSGLALIRKDKPFINDDGKITKRNAAWDSINAGKMDVALSSWNTAHAIHQPDLIHLVMRILKEHGIDYIRAPYDTGAQLMYLEHSPKQIIHASLAGPELLIYDVERVITTIDFTKQTFSAISKKDVLRDLMLTDDQFLDLCILAGGDQISTFPPFAQQSAFAPQSVERLLQHRNGFNLIRSNANDQQLSKYVDAFTRVRCAMRHHPILTDDGRVEPLNADTAPNDLHECIGFHLPDELYYYISRGLISDSALNALLCFYGAEFSPLCNGETKEYRNLISEDIIKIKAQTMTLIQSRLNKYYEHKVAVIHWYENNQSTSHEIKPDLAPVKVADISNWRSSKSVDNELKKAGIKTPNFAFALGLVANDNDAAGTVLQEKNSEKITPLSTLAEVQTRHISKLLQLRSFIESPSHSPSPFGKAILEASKAHPTSPPEFQDALFIALELVRLELLTSRPYSITYTKKQVLEDEAAIKAIRLISRTASLIGAHFKGGPKTWAGPLNRDLLAFNSVSKVLTRNLRHLGEALIIQMLMSNECQRDALEFTDLATQLPFAYETSTVLGILVKEYLEALVLNGGNNKEQALEQVEKNIGSTSASSLEDSIKEEVQRGFAFWDLVFDAVKSLEGAISKELLQEFQDANTWVKPRKV
ncbi:hypothetical protein BGZ46_006454 [Entomortierella lignicola]|nr:hypothetical protein BGZ46_006454 [Entomortierella lignicola]